MNQKHFIILFGLLVFIFIYVKNTHECHPTNNLSENDCKDNFAVTVKWLPEAKLNITIGNVAPYSEDYYVHAIGHFSFGDDIGHRYEFLKHPIFVNDHHCNSDGIGEVNPYTSTWSYDPDQTPNQGSNAYVWVSVYWFCEDGDEYGAIYCCAHDYFVPSIFNPTSG
ncbi:10963_t:CDS:1 [Cetraspora pellucida]|uniref:10963_t:CDS:1 n=1 Tax=Cetraspora pellucida TaxID=1433469 RepID=A0A9N8VW98_9GLOM|nr:10963_t:CDS:1 [Cetraspora pellucida]